MAMATRPAFAASELIAKGRESAAVQQALLGQQPVAAGEMPRGIRDLTEQILRCCDRALVALREGTEDAAGSDSRKRKPERSPNAPRTTSSKRMRVSNGERGIRVEKKWSMEDGFIWRKYGQKEIRDSKYPRLYFRCAYQDDHGCMARRRVQQSEADPTVYLITYFGKHTCRRENHEPPEPFVINFGSSSTRDRQPGGSPLSSSDDDGLDVSDDTSEICGLSEVEDLRADKGNIAELMEDPPPVPVLEPSGMSPPGWGPLDGCLDWELGDDESSFGFGELINSESSFDFGEFINFDYLGLLQ